MKYSKIEFTVPSAFLSLFINGDYNWYLNDQDIEDANSFLNHVKETYGHALFSGCQPVGMKTKNDVNNLFSDCSTLTLLIEEV